MQTIWSFPFDLEMLNKRSKGTFADYLNIKFVEIGNDYLIAEMPLEQHLCQPSGLLHGGASCALAETVGSAAANYCIDQKQKICVGMEININHIRSIRFGTTLAKAQPLHIGKTTQVWDIKIRNEQQTLIAVSRLTVAVIEKRL